MSLLDQLKRILRLSGDALTVSVHNRLGGLEQRLDDINLKLDLLAVRSDSITSRIAELRADLTHQNRQLAEGNAALLRGSIHLVEALKRLADESQQRHTQWAANIASRFEELDQSLSQRVAGLAHPLNCSLDTLRRDVSAGLATAVQDLQSQIQRLTPQKTHEDLLDSLRSYLLDGIAAQRQASEETKRMLGEVTALTTQVPATFERQLESLLAEIQQSLTAHRNASEHATQMLAEVSDLAHRVKSTVDNEIVHQVCVETDDYALANPEVGLLGFLYSYLPTNKVIDVGSHIGDFAERLLQVGFEVYALEPSPAAYAKLTSRLGARATFHAFNLAAGSSVGEMPLSSVKDLSGRGLYNDVSVFSSLVPHSMPEDLSFTGEAITVPVTTLDALHNDGLLPSDVSVVKIDTEGFDLEVIRGMQDRHYPVILAEYWDAGIPFGTSGMLYTLDSLVAEMKARTYLWYIVLYRVWGSNQTAYYSNHDKAVPRSWGNVVFFRDAGTFCQAQSWCSAALPRTYFKAAPAPHSD